MTWPNKNKDSSCWERPSITHTNKQKSDIWYQNNSKHDFPTTITTLNGFKWRIFTYFPFLSYKLTGNPNQHPSPKLLGTSSDSAELEARDAEGGAEQQQIPTGLLTEAQRSVGGAPKTATGVEHNKKKNCKYTATMCFSWIFRHLGKKKGLHCCNQQSRIV